MLKDIAQPSHLLILAIIIIVLFGWKKLPDAARSVGRSMRIFKSEMGEMKTEGKESKPSPAATDTVPGTTTPPQPAPAPPVAPAAQAVPPVVAPAVPPVVAPAVPPVVAPVAPPVVQQTPPHVDAPVAQPQAAEPVRHDNPAL